MRGCVRCGFIDRHWTGKGVRASYCKPCSLMINRQIQRWLDGGWASYDEFAAILGVSRDFLDARVKRIRAAQAAG